MRFYLLYKDHGLYDPVLDDQEPLYDYELESLGQQSEPTEVVFQIQKFVEPSDIGSNPIDFDLNGNTIPLTESRSLTASPFVTPTKPYRPFSTEPVVEVPPLEDPIILNPNYRDEFGKSPIDSDPDYILSAHCKNGLASDGKYKLPISEQYDPDGTRFKQSAEVVEKLLKYEKHVKSLSKNVEVVDVTKETKVCDTVTKDVRKSSVSDAKSKGVTIKEDVSENRDVKVSEELSKREESIRKDSRTVEEKETFTEEIEEEAIREELKYIEKMKQEIDLEKIEETALSVVEDSIERAVSVTEEIKKEMEEEMSSTSVESKSKQVSETEHRDVSKSVKSENLQETDDIKEYDDRKVSREEQYETEEDELRRVVKKDIKESDISEKVSKADGKVAYEKKSLISEEHAHKEVREEPKRRESAEHESFEAKFEKHDEAKKVTTTVTGAKVDKGAEQRAYTIGLQTIPNIRGVVHSSYHYDLLLRTFFIHLTDVMVALSRFVLTQPIFNQLETSQETVTTHLYEAAERDLKMKKSSQEVIEKKVESKSQEVKMQQEKKEIVKPTPVTEVKAVSQKIEKEIKVESQQKKIERTEIIKPVAVKKVKQDVKAEIVEVKKGEKIAVEVSEKKTGAQMAQRSEKKLTQEMTQKMDAVISEFQTIAVEEDVKKDMLQRSRRSSSRSQIEEEVMKEGDPLEWLSKVDSRRTSQERTETSKTAFSSSEKAEKKSFVESKQEIKHKTSKTPKQIYVAIVESHVYTNKDAIFEEQVTDFSETSSVQSAEEINTAIEAVETVSSENVAIESAIRELETAKVIEETHKLANVTAQSAATVQKIEEVVHESKELVQEEFKKATAIQSQDIQEVFLVQETKEIIEPVVEIKETKIDQVEKVAIDVNESLFVAESLEVSTHDSKSEFTNAEVKEESVAIVEEVREEEKAIESEVEVLESKPVEIVEITETVKVKPGKKTHDEFAQLKIIKKVESDVILSPEIIEVEDISELISKSVVSQVGVGQQLEAGSSKLMIEKSYVSSEIGMATSASMQQSVDVSQASHVSQVASMKKETLQSESVTQKSSFTAKSSDRKLSLRTDLETQSSVQSPPSTINTPTPSTVPPTPLTDEYVFKLSLPLPPRSRSATPVPRDCTLSPEDEDPHIVKKKLVPHIETTIDRVIYDPPLPTPPADKVECPVYNKPVLNGGANLRLPMYTKPGLKGGAKFRLPVYRKPGLFGGADEPEYAKEEIREIERKSSLLASAIDETIKSIEEYKEEVGIETKKEVKVEKFKEERVSKSYQESYSEEVRTESKQNGFEEIDAKIEEIMEQCESLGTIGEANDVKIQKMEENSSYVKEEDSKETSKTKEVIIKTEIEHKKANSEEKSVKFDDEVKIVEVESIEDKIIETETREKFPEIIAEQKITQEVPAVVEVRETVAVEIDMMKEKELELKSNDTVRTETQEKPDPLLGFRPVVFDPEGTKKRNAHLPEYQEATGIPEPRQSPYMTETGELIGTIQGIVDGLEDPVMDEEVAKELGKPGISEEKIATLISGEAEMLREAHVMGLARVLTSHMHRADDSSVDFQKIKPMINSLKDSEVLKALNEELAIQQAEEKKKEEKKWTTFLQKPKRPVPKAKFGYHGWTEDEEIVAEPYKVKIVKQAKPKVAPDYKPEDFETGPLPWEERAVTEASLPPVEPEEPILIPEVPEFFEAVDPLKESEVPDLEDTGIPLPPPRNPTPPPVIEEQIEEPVTEEQEVAAEEEVAPTEETQETREVMDNRLAEQLVRSVQSMVDPNATVDQQLAQMRAQLAALAQLPEVIQQSLELVSKQLSKMTHQEAQMELSASHVESQNYQQVEVIQNHTGSEMQTIQEGNENAEAQHNESQKMTIEEVTEEMKPQQNNADVEDQYVMQQDIRRVATPVNPEEEMKREKQRKEQERLDHESRYVKHHPTPRVAPSKAKKMFGPLDPDEARAVVLPGGRRWRKTQDVYDEQRIAETLQAHSELLQGKTMGINFMKYEKPPVSLDHLKHSEVYKLVHDMDQTPLKRVEMRTPVMCEADYRERCRSMTPSVEKKHLQIPQQFHP